MAKNNKVPKKLLGYKLSKGTRKDIKKLLKMLGDPDARTIAMSVASALAGFLAEKFAEPKPARTPRRTRTAAAAH